MSSPAAAAIFAAHVVTGADTDAPTLLGAWCAACEAWSFPWTPNCRRCDGPNEQRSAGSRGTLYSLTTVRSKPPLGFPQPYSLAYIDLDDAPLRVLMPVAPAAGAQAGTPATIGTRVRLTVVPLGHDAAGQPCLRPLFQTEPAKA